MEITQLREELHLAKKENERDTKSDHQKAELRDSYNALKLENSKL